MYPVELTADFSGWKLFMARKADIAFRPFSEKVFTRDQYTCQYCGFRARDYQEVVNLDHNYQNNKVANLVTACCFCTQCFFLQSVGVGDYGGGVLIYLPEFAQVKVNSLCHVLFCAMQNDAGYSNAAETMFRAMRLRAQWVDQQFGEGVSEPAVFGQLLIEAAPPTDIMKRALKDIRLLPSRNRFLKQIEHWIKVAQQELAVESANGKPISVTTTQDT